MWRDGTNRMPRREMAPFMHFLVQEHCHRADNYGWKANREHNDLVPGKAALLRLWLVRWLQCHNPNGKRCNRERLERRMGGEEPQ